MENVAALVSQKFIKTFQQWMSLLDSYGYRNYAQVLNAKDYCVPQNRERIFLVSVREDCEPEQYYFPKAQKLTRLMKDVLEQNVDEKYYLKDERIADFDGRKISNHQWGYVNRKEDHSVRALCSSDYKDAPKILEDEKTETENSEQC